MKHIKFVCFRFLAFLILFWVSFSNAATYYVAPNGSDSNPGTEALPWLTLYNSTEKLYAGDTLLVKNGTYASRTRSEWYIPGIAFDRSGTSGNPITVKAYPGHTPVIDGRTANHFTIGAYQKSWITIEGLRLIYGFFSFHSCSNITIQNCDIEYGKTDPGDSSHTHAIRIESSPNTLIKNNKIYNLKYTDPSTNYNKVAIMLYGNNSTTIENNEIYDNLIGFRDKCGGSCSSNTNIVRYNIFRNNTYYGIFMGGYATASQNDRIYQNIFLNNPGNSIYVSQGNTGLHIYNNVFYCDSSCSGVQGGLYQGPYSGNTNMQIYNNIIRGIRSPVSVETPLPSGFYVDYNSYSTYNNFYYNESWITFSQFKTNVGNNNYVQNNVDPLFVNPATRDFRLQSGSPARNAGQGGVNMGAYITGNEIIGLISETPSDTIPPSTPTNLTANAISSSQINLSWTASTDNVGVTGYRIYRCQGSGCTPTTQVATSPTNSYQNTGLAASTTYLYRVQAYDAAGNLSSYSSTVSATTQPQDTTPPASPTGFRIE